MKRVRSDVRRTLIWLQHRRPKTKPSSTKSAPQRNRRFARQLAASVRIGTAQRGKRFTGAICRRAGASAAQVCAQHGAYMDVGFLCLFFFCAVRQNTQKPCPHFKDISGSVLPQQGMPQHWLLHCSCIAARDHCLSCRRADLAENAREGSRAGMQGQCTVPGTTVGPPRGISSGGGGGHAGCAAAAAACVPLSL